MPAFVIPYTVPGNYTYNSSEIEVSGGLAQILEDKTNVYARYHKNQSAGTNVPDDSGNGRDGTTVNMVDGDWVTGKLGNCLLFDGTKHVDLGTIANFEYTQAFSVECWFRTTTAATLAFLSKMTTSASYRGWLFYMTPAGSVGLILRNSTSKYISVLGGIGLNDDSWHHGVITYSGNGLAAGLDIYVDGSPVGVTVVSDSLAASTIVGAGITCIAAQNKVDKLFNGYIDESAIYDRVITPAEVTYRWNTGNGIEDFKPRLAVTSTIYKTAGDSAVGITEFQDFTETPGPRHNGVLAYQLSDDGASWLYWDGGAWSVAGGGDYNSAATVAANITDFPVTESAIWVKAFLISDGVQFAELDQNQVTYTINQAPVVNAGANKVCLDHETIAPFSDCDFYDPDGTVDHAYYKVDGEVDVWTEILQGGYGSLLEAVQAWTYEFNNVGIITVRLQVEDNEAAKSEDDLTVTVSKHTVTFNVRHFDSGSHLVGLSFLPGDGSPPQSKDSPFTWDYDWSGSDRLVTISKAGFLGIYDLPVSTTVHTEDIRLTPECVCGGNVGAKWDPTGLKLVVNAWMTVHGRIAVYGVTAVEISVETFDAGGSITTLDTKDTTTINARGVAELEFSSAELGGDLSPDELYSITGTITYAGIDYALVSPFVFDLQGDAKEAKQDTIISNQASLGTLANQTDMIATLATLGTLANQTSMIATLATLGTEAKQDTIIATLATLATLTNQTDMIATLATLGTLANQTSMIATLATLGTEAKQDTIIATLATLGTLANQVSMIATLATLGTEAKQDTIISTLATLGTLANQVSMIDTLDTLGTEAKQDTIISTLATLGTLSNQVSMIATLATLGTEAKQDIIIATQATLGTLANQVSMIATLATLGTEAKQDTIIATLATLGTLAKQNDIISKLDTEIGTLANQTSMIATLATLGTEAKQDIIIAAQATLATLTNQEDILALVEKLDEIESGRWKLDEVANQMIFYAADGITPRLTFNLFNKDGNPSVVAPFERVPV